MEPINKWHEAVSTKNYQLLEEILDDTVIFYSPVTFTPQKGKAITKIYLSAAAEVFERDCLIYLGTCIAAKGLGKVGKPCFTWSLEGDVNDSGTCNFGDILLIEMGPDQQSAITCEPAKGFDLGAGNGKKVTHEVKGGTVGLLIDGRGRPLGLPEDRQQCQQTISQWVKNMQLYSNESEGV